MTPGRAIRTDVREVPKLDLQGERVYQRYQCGDRYFERQFDGAIDKEVDQEHEEDFAPYSNPGVTVVSIKDNPNKDRQWFPSGASSQWKNAQVQTVNGTMMDRDVLPDGSCDFRMSYNGDRSEYPFPTTAEFGTVERRISSIDCANGANVHGFVPSIFAFLQMNFNLQAVHYRLSTAARHAKWAYNMRLLKWWTPENDYKLKVEL